MMDSEIEELQGKIRNFEYTPNRKRWMRAFALLIVVEILPFLILMFGSKSFVAPLLMMLVIGLPSFTFWFLTYLMGYQREGSKWLLWVLIILPLSFVRSMGVLGEFALVLIVFSPAYIYFWLKTLKLRRQNLLKKISMKLEQNKISREVFFKSATRLVDSLA